MRDVLQLVPGVAAAALYAASIGVIAGAVGFIQAGSLARGVQVAVISTGVASLLIGYALWRAHRPPRRAYLDKRYHGQ